MNVPFLYKLCRSVVPMVLLTLSVGWCYSWSLFAGPIAESLCVSKAAVQMVFCLNIFFLGMGAAFFGNLVEKKIKLSSMLSTVLLSVGFLLSAYGIHVHSILLVCLGSGVACGLAQGIAYVISPKNLLLWWNKTQYKATIMSLSIVCFGLGSSICALLFNALLPVLGIENLLVALGAIYTCAMAVATVLINKPKFALNKIKSAPPFDFKSTFSDRSFWRLWLFMFLNISAGLILIGNCAQILATTGLSLSLIITVMFLCGIANGTGRLIFPVLTDWMKKKLLICIVILAIEVGLVFPTLLAPITIPLMVVLVNATYGAAFAVLPTLILSTFGKEKLTVCHSLVLSAWGIASVFAYICITILQSGGVGIVGTLICILAMYLLNLANVWKFKCCS